MIVGVNPVTFHAGKFLRSVHVEGLGEDGLAVVHVDSRVTS